jgi:hypothetical protein
MPSGTSDFLWSDPFPPHSLENVGDAELRVIKHAILGGTKPADRRHAVRVMSPRRLSAPFEDPRR